MNSHMYKYSKIYLHSGTSTWSGMLEGMFEDCDWIIQRYGKISQPNGRWCFVDRVVENGYQRIYTFKHPEDYAAFVLARG